MSRKPGRLRVIFDCNILLQAHAFEDGPASECLRLFESGEIELFISATVINELRRVLTYEEVRAISSNMTQPRIDGFLQRLLYRATFLRRVRHAFDFPRDPKDEPYLNLATAAHADFLVTRDKDMLSLNTGHSHFCMQFRRKTHPLKIVDPISFLKAVGHR